MTERRREEGPRRPRQRRAPDQVRTGEPEGIAAVLDRLLGDRPWRTGVALAGLARRWDEVVGDRLAEESEPVRIDAGVLEVAARSAAWAAQLSFLAGEVRTRANDVLGRPEVVSVRVVVRPHARPTDPGTRRDR